MWSFLKDRELHTKVDRLLALVAALTTKEELMSQGLELLQQEVEAIRTVNDSAIALITGLVEKLKDVTTLSEVQTICAELETEKERLAAALVANTEVTPAADAGAPQVAEASAPAAEM